MALLTFEEVMSILWNCVSNQNSVDTIKETLSEDHSNKDKVSLALKNLELFHLLPFYKERGLKSEKSESMSIALRSAGNKAFTQSKPNLQEALQLYTKSIACAPFPKGQTARSEQLALALGNRSAVFFAMSKYDLCLKDIEQALKHKYPNNLKLKLYERMGKCYLYIGKRTKAVASFQNGISSISIESSLSEESLKSTITRLENLKIQAEMTQSETCPSNQPSKIVQSLPQISYEQNRKIPSFSNCIDVNRSVEMGERFVQANKDIQPGDVLVVEKPYSSILLPEDYWTHCYQCLRRCESLIPCKHCATVMFCSEICRKESWQVHRIECPILSSLLKFMPDHDWLLALRALLVATVKSNGLAEFQNNVKVLELNHHDEDITGYEANKRYQCTDPQYSVIHYLNQNTGYRTFKSVYRLATIAACILNCLDIHTEFFDKLSGDDDARLFVGSMLLQNLLSLSCNSYTVADLVLTTTRKKFVNTESIGNAVYAFSSFFNHSCDPNVFRSYHSGDVMSIVALRPIRRGEQVFCDYGYSHSEMEIEERRCLLVSQYFFTCTCEACVEGWPTSSLMETLDPTFLCPQCALPLVQQDTSVDFEVCSGCRKKTKMSALRKELDNLSSSICEIKLRLLDGKRIDFSDDVATMLKRLEKLVERPAQIITVTQDVLRHNMLITGNFYQI